MELGQLEKRDKAPRRIIHFSSGETMEEYSTDEEEAEEREAERKDLLSPPVDAVRVRMDGGREASPDTLYDCMEVTGGCSLCCSPR